MNKLSAAVLALTMMTAPALAAPPGMRCIPAEARLANLEQYGEQPFAVGVENGGELLLNVWINPETRSWTVVMVTPRGHWCPLSAGEAFTVLDLQPVGDDS